MNDPRRDPARFSPMLEFTRVDMNPEFRDVFLCHASEDKKTIVRPLRDALADAGITSWLDEAEIHWGDSLVDRIQQGLRDSRFVIVVLSTAFLAKPWPRRELAAALSQEASTGMIRVLPLLAGSERERQEILANLPLLNDKLHVVWEGNPNNVIDAMKRRLSKDEAGLYSAGKEKELGGIGATYCARCGATPGKPSQCPGYASHSFGRGTGGEYCVHCGTKTGEPTKCVGYANHSFTSGTGDEYCVRCGAKTGQASKCVGYANHSFKRGTGHEYCVRCGAKTGQTSKCVGYANHSFTSGTGGEYCVRCGAATGEPTNCRGYASHSFVK